jgi:hypothetical protein
VARRGTALAAIALAALLLSGCRALVPHAGYPVGFERALGGAEFLPLAVPTDMISADAAVATARIYASEGRVAPSPPFFGIVRCPLERACAFVGTESGEPIPIWIVDWPGDALVLVDAREGLAIPPLFFPHPERRDRGR